MKSNLYRLAPVAALLVLTFVASATAQDFSKSYPVGAGGSVSIHNVSGDVRVTGYNGEVIVVNAFKEGRDRDMVEVEDRSQGNSIDLNARYDGCRHCSINASIRFEVQVPRSANVNFDEIETASGNVSVRDVTGRIRVNTASGDVLVQNVNGHISASTASGEMSVKNVVGSVKADSASGNVEVEMARLEGTDDLVFSTASGDVNVRMPANLDADVEMSTTSGSLSTDFPLEVRREEYGPTRSARGRLGTGARTLRISSASGDVHLQKL